MRVQVKAVTGWDLISLCFFLKYLGKLTLVAPCFVPHVNGHCFVYLDLIE
jgi:hypothetical protein